MNSNPAFEIEDLDAVPATNDQPTLKTPHWRVRILKQVAVPPPFAPVRPLRAEAPTALHEEVLAHRWTQNLGVQGSAAAKLEPVAGVLGKLMRFESWFQLEEPKRNYPTHWCKGWLQYLRTPPHRLIRDSRKVTNGSCHLSPRRVVQRLTSRPVPFLDP